VASFGPIEIRQNSPKYGFITNTPKKHWANTDFVGPLKKYFNLPIAWTTDVNGSAYGEYVLATLFNQQVTTPSALVLGLVKWSTATLSVNWGTLKLAISASSVTLMTWIFPVFALITVTAWKDWSVGRLFRRG
jgi:hypothetical protein